MNPQNPNPIQPQQPLPQQPVTPQPQVPQPSAIIVEGAATAGTSILPKIIIGLVITALVGGGGYYLYQNFVKTGKISLSSVPNLSSIPGVSQLLPIKPISKIEAFQAGTKTMSWDITTKKMNWDYAALLSLGSKIQNAADATPTYKVTYADGSTKDFTLAQMQAEMKKPEVLKQLGIDSQQVSTLFTPSTGNLPSSNSPSNVPQPTANLLNLTEDQFKAITPTKEEIDHNLEVTRNGLYIEVNKTFSITYAQNRDDPTSADMEVVINIWYRPDWKSVPSFKSIFPDSVEESLNLGDSSLATISTNPKNTHGYGYWLTTLRKGWVLKADVNSPDKDVSKQEALRLMNIMLSRIQK